MIGYTGEARVAGYYLLNLTDNSATERRACGVLNLEYKYMPLKKTQLVFTGK